MPESPGGGRLPAEGSAEELCERVLTRYQAALAATGDAVWEWSLEGGEDWWSDRCYELLEYDKTVAPSFDAFRARVHPEDLPALSRRMEADLAGSATTFENEYRLLLPGDRVLIVNARGCLLRSDDGVPRRLVGVFRDVTKQRQLEEELRQAHKMESIGRLAGGIAHDFNNLLTVILGSVSLAEHQLPANSPVRSDLECVREAADRAARLTLQLLAFARRQVVEPTLVDINELTRRMDRMLHRTIGEHIELHTLLEPDLGMVRADVGQMEQVLVNLAVNARDAMPSGGKLTIETANVTLDEEHARARAGLDAGPYVMLTVTDSGPGIAPDLRDHVFEPFFSTKEQGTGLGLATCYGIVHQSGGTIVVDDDEPGRGARFKILLPRAGRGIERQRTPLNGTRAPGHETVLFVEDEPGVRRVGVRLLETRGYRVLEASSADDALRAARGHTEPIRLLITDVVMPGMSGPELAGRLRELRPDIEVLFTSGYAEYAAARYAELTSEAAFLQKPYTQQGLLAKIRTILDD